MFKNLTYKIQAFRKCCSFDNALQVIVSHLFFPQGNILYVWSGHTLVVDGRRGETAGGIHAVLVSDEYKHFLRKIDPGSVLNIMDLGANVGSFCILAKSIFPSLQRIVTVEGDHTVLPRLEYNIHSNFDRRDVSIIHAAVAGHDGQVTFFQNPTSVGSGTSRPEDTEGLVEVTVPAVSLTTVLKSFGACQIVDICKMDIEGSEFAALRALPDAELSRLRFIIAELHGSDQENDELITHLVGKGYSHIPSGEDGNPRTHGFLRIPKA